jgi:hypothetical protein
MCLVCWVLTPAALTVVLRGALLAVPPLGAQVLCTCRARVRRRTDVPRLLGTHTRGTHCSSTSRCTVGLSSARRAGLTHVPCARSAAWYGSPLYARMCIWDCAHHSPPQLNPPPAHICNWTESIPCPPLHRERVRPPPASAPQPTPSLADICATTAALRDICLCPTQV